ncbi:glycosyltransferase family 2 protein [Bacteroidota bacterium]
MPKLSVVIICLNEERNIERCLKSVQSVADDLVVVDSFSTDRTEEICKKYKARFIQHEFSGHIEQKNWAITKAKYPHILSLDADEALSERLIQSILFIKDNWEYDGYYFNRMNNYCGKWIKHTSWYPDRKLRLWDSRKGTWGGKNPHDKYLLNKDAKQKFIKGDLHHHVIYTFEEHIKKLDHFSTIAAYEHYRNGEKNGLRKILVHSFWRFFREYFIHLGFLDGYYGFLISSMSAIYSFMKYVKLRQLYREEKLANKKD